MKTMCRMWLVCLVLMFSGTAYAKTIKMAVFKLEPFMMEHQARHEVYGVTVDYWKDFLAPEIGVDLEVVGVFPILRTLHMLKTGAVDVVSQLTRIPDREADFLYPETPITTIESCIIVLKDSPIHEISRSEDLFGLTVGYIKAGFIPDMLVHPRITLDLVTTTDFRLMNYKKLMNKRVDALLDINVVSQTYWMKTKGYLNEVRIIVLPAPPVNVYSIFRKTGDGASLRDAYDKANRKGLENHVFEKISETYLNH